MRRRLFLQKAAAVTAVASHVLPRTARAQAGANDVVRVALIGCGVRGPTLAKDLAKVAGAKLVLVCDVDPARAAAVASANGNLPVEMDYRKVMERKDVDAVIIATPNHLHTLIAVTACLAGKDVYVEKPVSHSIHEGRVLAEIARKTGRIVQSGLQNSSDIALAPCREYFRAGSLGKLQAAHAFWYRVREPIGKIQAPTPVGKEIAYDLFRGPRPLEPLCRTKLHYDWHWFWDTGNGELGNTLVHNIDHTRLLLGITGHATAVCSVGGRLLWDDDGQTPNTHISALKYPGVDVPVTCEVRDLPHSPGKADMESRFRKKTCGTFLLCENGLLYFDRGGGYAEDKDGKVIQRFKGDGGAGHMANFIAAVRSRDAASLRSPIEQGHISSCGCHMANISHRTGRAGYDLAGAEKALPAMLLAATEAWAEFKSHIQINNVDLAKTPLTVGAELAFDPKSERFIENSEQARMANYLVEDAYRAPFTLPAI